jgi:hypothetical protein
LCFIRIFLLFYRSYEVYGDLVVLYLPSVFRERQGTDERKRCYEKRIVFKVFENRQYLALNEMVYG